MTISWYKRKRKIDHLNGIERVQERYAGVNQVSFHWVTIE